ncbi:hypothetical protein G9A89_010444 [Geosiphon pyriformis]|nr:hypothetical protein G9A89_010444 [Geosiphon pyriformis]
MFFGLELNSSLDNYVTMMFYSASTKFFCDIGFISEYLLASKHGSIDVYTDGFVRDLESIGVCNSAAAYFLKANMNIGVKVLGLLFFILVELQAITLTLKCVLVSSTVILFTNSQALLDICKYNVGVSVLRTGLFLRTHVILLEVCLMPSILSVENPDVAPTSLMLVLLATSIHLILFYEVFVLLPTSYYKEEVV